jgi:hypothetical protein
MSSNVYVGGVYQRIGVDSSVCRRDTGIRSQWSSMCVLWLQ